VPTRFCVVVATDTDAVAALAADAGATVVDDTRTNPAGETVAVLLFADGSEVAASRTGTCFGSHWAALEHARFKASHDERTYEAPSASGGYVDDPSAERYFDITTLSAPQFRG
jgi:hypothetical protein